MKERFTIIMNYNFYATASKGNIILSLGGDNAIKIRHQIKKLYVDEEFEKRLETGLDLHIWDGLYSSFFIKKPALH